MNDVLPDNCGCRKVAGTFFAAPLLDRVKTAPNLRLGPSYDASKSVVALAQVDRAIDQLVASVVEGARFLRA